MFERKDRSKATERITVVALDISSTDTGVCLGCGDKVVTFGHVEKNVVTGDYLDLLKFGDDIVSRIKGSFEYESCSGMAVFVEQPFYVPGKSTPAPVFMTHGIILNKLYDFSQAYFKDCFYWNEVSVSTWRNWLFRRHNFKPKSRKSKEQKEYTKALLAKHYKIQHDNNNALDAAGIMLWALDNIKNNC